MAGNMNALFIVAGAAAVLLLSGCDSSVTAPFSYISNVVDGSQTAEVGTAVPRVPVLSLTYPNGTPAVGVPVTFVVEVGTGHVAIDSTTTDVVGRASPRRWVLGKTAGVNVLTARIAGGQVVRFSAIGVAGPAAFIQSVAMPAYVLRAGEAVRPSVAVTDSFGNPVSGQSITFADSAGQVERPESVSDETGTASPGAWTPNPHAQFHVLRVAASAFVTLSVRAQTLREEPRLIALTPIAQTNFETANVPVVPRVLVTDGAGVPLPGIPVQFQVVGGSEGAAATDIIESDTDGVASPVDWRLRVGQSVLRATVPGFSSGVEFTAERGARSTFSVELRFYSVYSSDARDIVVAAAAAWMRLIKGDLPDVHLKIPAGLCDDGSSPAMDEVVDDVIITISTKPIDGRGGIIAGAGPCVRRTPSRHTVLGSIVFDDADVQQLIISRRLQSVAQHEMAHVLGFGTAWVEKGLLAGFGTLDPVFTGASAVQHWQSWGARGEGQLVPVENLGGQGTRDSHWRESVFDAELMTGFLEPPGTAMPISALTLASFEDLGYLVDYSALVSFSSVVAGPLQSSASQGEPLRERILPVRREILVDSQR